MMQKEGADVICRRGGALVGEIWQIQTQIKFGKLKDSVPHAYLCPHLLGQIVTCDYFYVTWQTFTFIIYFFCNLG